MKFLKAACIVSLLAVYTAIASAPFTLRFDSQTPDVEAEVKANQLADLTLKVYSYTEGEQNTLTTNDFAVFGYGTNWDFSTALVHVSGSAQTSSNYFEINLAGSNLPAAGSFFYQIMQTNRTSIDVHILGRGIMSVMRSPISGGAGSLNLQQIVNWSQVRNLNEGPWIMTNSATWLDMVAFTNGLLTTNATAWIAYGARIGSNELNIIIETNRAFQAENGIRLELVGATNRIAVLETNTATKAQGITATNALVQVIAETNRAQVAEGILSGSIQGVAGRVTSLETTNYYAQVSSNAILAYNTNVLIVSGTLNHNAAGEYIFVDAQYAPYAGYGLNYFSGPVAEDGYTNILTTIATGAHPLRFLGHPAAPYDPAPGFVNYEWAKSGDNVAMPLDVIGVYAPDTGTGGAEQATGTATVSYKITGTNGWIVTTNWIRLGTAAASAAGDFATAAQGVKADSALQSIPGYYVTNGQDVSFGSISGNGSGLTNVNAAFLDGHTSEALINAAATYYFTTGLVSYGAVTGRLASLDIPTVVESVTYSGPVTSGQYFASYLIPSNMMPASLEVGEYVFKFYGGHTSQPAKNPTIRGDLYIVNAASGVVVQEFESTIPVIMPLAPEYFYIHVLVTNSVPRDGYAFLLKTKLVATDGYTGDFISYFGRPYLPGFTLAKAPGIWVSHAEYDPVQGAIISTQVWQTAAIANVSGTVSTALQPVSTQGLVSVINGTGFSSTTNGQTVTFTIAAVANQSPLTNDVNGNGFSVTNLASLGFTNGIVASNIVTIGNTHAPNTVLAGTAGAAPIWTNAISGTMVTGAMTAVSIVQTSASASNSFAASTNVFTGRVGIGTNAPSNKLFVTDTATPINAERVLEGQAGGCVNMRNTGTNINTGCRLNFQSQTFSNVFINDGWINTLVTTSGLSPASRVADLVFATRPSGSADPIESMRITGAGVISGNGSGLTNLQMNGYGVTGQSNCLQVGWPGSTNQFGTTGYGITPIVANPAWTNMISITNAGFAVGAKRLYIQARVSNGTEVGKGIYFSYTNTGLTGTYFPVTAPVAGLVAYGTATMPLNSSGMLYYYCNTNTSVGFSVNCADY